MPSYLRLTSRLPLYHSSSQHTPPHSDQHGQVDHEHEAARPTLSYLFHHHDTELSATLSYDEESGLWIICYYRGNKQMSQSLYPAQSTAELLLLSMGYTSQTEVAS